MDNLEFSLPLLIVSENINDSLFQTLKAFPNSLTFCEANASALRVTKPNLLSFRKHTLTANVTGFSFRHYISSAALLSNGSFIRIFLQLRITILRLFEQNLRLSVHSVPRKTDLPITG